MNARREGLVIPAVLALLLAAESSHAGAPPRRCVPNRDELVAALDRHCAAAGRPDGSAGASADARPDATVGAAVSAEVRRVCALMRARLAQCLAPGTELGGGEYDGSVYVLADRESAAAGTAARFRLEMGFREGGFRVDRLVREVDGSVEAIGACGSPRRRGLRRALAGACKERGGGLRAGCAALDAVLRRCEQWLPASRQSDGGVRLIARERRATGGARGRGGREGRDGAKGRERTCGVVCREGKGTWSVAELECCGECW